ncbi:hypothetical protein [Lacrimispora sp.]|uniref:hypothetical protein n=1 Tax=Lacrimispora sp. TaxID=2719234 RepID=UPI002FD8F533
MIGALRRFGYAQCADASLRHGKVTDNYIHNKSPSRGNRVLGLSMKQTVLYTNIYEKESILTFK